MIFKKVEVLLKNISSTSLLQLYKIILRKPKLLNKKVEECVFCGGDRCVTLGYDKCVSLGCDKCGTLITEYNSRITEYNIE